MNELEARLSAISDNDPVNISLQGLDDETLGRVVNLSLCEMYKRDLPVEFVQDCLSDMANWALYGKA